MIATRIEARLAIAQRKLEGFIGKSKEWWVALETRDHNPV
jgi:hypothetical protein